MLKFPLFILLFASGCVLSAERPYRPQYSSAIKNPLNWAWQEIADDKRIVTVTVAQDQSVWMGFEQGYIIHKGPEKTTEYRIVERNQYPRILSIFTTEDNQVYASVTDGVYYYSGGSWIPMTTPITEGLTTQPLVELSDQTIWYCNNQGIGTIADGSYEPVIETTKAILSICEVDKQHVWILSDGGEKLYQAKRDSKTLAPKSQWRLIDEFPPAPKSGGRLFKDSQGYVWIINANLECPVYRYDVSTLKFDVYELSKLGGDNYNNDITETPDGKIWISGRTSLHSFNGDNWQVYEQSDGIPSSYRMEIEADSDGFLFILDGGTSLVRVDLKGKYFKKIQGLHYQASTADLNWYISYRGTVVSENPKTDDWIEYTHEDGIMKTILSLSTTSIGDVVCVGSENGAATVSILNHGSNQWSKLRFPEFSETFARDSFFELEDGSFLLGSMPPENELFSNKTRGILHLKKGPNDYSVTSFLPEQSPEVAININQTSDGRFWTNHFGVSSFTDSVSAQVYRPPEWYFNWVEQMAITNDDRVWLSLWGLGVYSFKDGNWKHYSSDEGLVTKSTNQLIRLQDDTLITSTDIGLFRYDGNHWIPFLDRSLEMYRDTGTLEQKGSTIWINRTNSDWYDRWTKEVVVNPAMESSFYTLRYQQDNEAPETLLLSETKTVIENRQIRIEWTGNDRWSKTPRERLQYSMRIDRGKWSEFSQVNSITLNNLSHGLHIFEVRARDEDFNVDASPAQMSIMVSLPFWKQPWFYFIMSLAAIGVGILIATIIRLKIKHIEELDELRNHFFINLSHELRTPISLISIPIERLKALSKSEEQQKNLSMMELNIRRLSVLVDQLLDFRAIEKGKLTFDHQKVDLPALLTSLVEIFENQAQQKHLAITFRTTHSHCITNFDPDIFQKIADNLISNAIKYTPEGGQVSILFSIDAQTQSTIKNGDGPIVNLTVEDNGNGIHPEIQKHIFEPFYRGKNGLTNKGYGIGLALVKEMLDSLGGTIKVESPIFSKDTEHPGSRFIASFPIEKPDQLVPANTSDKISISSFETDGTEFFNPDDHSKKRLLLVEDNLELRNLIAVDLSKTYNVATSTNGAHGLVAANELIPDVIIVDVMMPEMDGFEFTKEVKSNSTTAHIPIIILTALKSSEHQKQGLDIGADDYLTKPVSTEILHLKIRNLLQTRDHLKLKVRNQFQIEESSTALDDHYTQFMSKMSDIIMDNIDNPDFDVDFMAKQVGMSRSGFYRKFEAVSGEQPANYIRSLRMKHAAKLILEGELNITEIALSVGFTEGANFSRSFKQHFKCPPSKYKTTYQR